MIEAAPGLAKGEKHGDERRGAQPEPYPVTFSVDYPERQLNRLTTFFRVFTVIPIAIVVGLLPGGSIGNCTANTAPPIATGTVIFALIVLMLLFRKKYPRWWYDWNLEFLRFANRVAVYLALMDDEYPSTDEMQAVRLDFAYPDAERLERGLPLADTAGIRSARLILELVDDLHGAHLGRARHRTGRKAGHQRIDGVEVGGEGAFDIGHDVDHLAVIFEKEAVGDAHAAHFGNPADIVAAKIEQHQMLGALLGIGQQLIGERLILFGRCPAWPCAGNRPDGDLAVANPDQNLGARSDHGEAAEIQIIEEGGGIDPAQRPIKREGGERERRLEALAQHHLKDVAGGNVVLGAFDLCHISLRFGGGPGLRMGGVNIQLAAMRQRLLEPLQNEVEPVGRAHRPPWRSHRAPA